MEGLSGPDRPFVQRCFHRFRVRSSGKMAHRPVDRQADGRNASAGPAVSSVLRRGSFELLALSRFEVTLNCPEVLAYFLFRMQFRTEFAERRFTGQCSSNGFSIIV